MKHLDYNIILFSGEIASIDEVRTGTSKNGTQWSKRTFSVTCKYDFKSQRRFFCTLWGESASMLNNLCVGEPVTVVGSATSYKGQNGWREGVEVKTVYAKTEGLPDLNEIYNQ